MKYCKTIIKFFLIIFIFFRPVFSKTEIPVVLSPNGGETYYTGSVVPIIWGGDLSKKETEIVIVLYKSGIKFLTIAHSTENKGNFAWMIPENIPAGKDYRIRIRIKSNLSLNDFSDADFEIKKKR